MAQNGTTLFGLGVNDYTLTKPQEIGTQTFTDNGTEYRLCKATTAVALHTGVSADSTTNVNLVILASKPAGAPQIEVSNTLTENQLEGATVILADGSNVVVESNTATTGGTAIITFTAPAPYAITTLTAIAIPSKYRIKSGGTAIAYSTIAVPAGAYFFARVA